MKPFARLVLGTLLGLGSNASAAVCSAQFAGKAMAHVQIGDRVIEIIGWDHPDAPDALAQQNALDQMLTRARARDCAGAEAALTKGLRRETAARGKQGFVSHALDELDRVRPLARVGSEISPEEWSTGKGPDIDAIRAQLSEVVHQCGRLAAGVRAFESLAFGPEWDFVTRHRLAPNPPSILPAESYDLRMRNMVDFNTPVTFDFDDEHAKYRNRPGYHEVFAALWESRQPSDADIKRLAVHSGLPRGRAERTLRDDIATWQRRIAGAYLRNGFIARSMTSEPGHHALVIGHRHVSNLVDQLLKSCGSMPTPSAIYSAPGSAAAY